MSWELSNGEKYNDKRFSKALSLPLEPTKDWYQGRGVYGGLVFAQLVSALRAHSNLPIRRLTIEMCAPVLAAPFEIEVQETRRGSNSHFFYVKAVQRGKVVAQATAVCGGSRNNSYDTHLHPATQKRRQQLRQCPQKQYMPAFTQHFEYWPTLGAMPFSGAEDLTCGVGSVHATIPSSTRRWRRHWSMHGGLAYPWRQANQGRSAQSPAPSTSRSQSPLSKKNPVFWKIPVWKFKTATP